MGTEINGNSGEVIRTDTGRTTEKGSAGSESTQTANTERTSSRGDTGGRIGVRTTEENKEQEFSRLAILNEEEKKAYERADEDEKKRLLRNAKRREKYAKEKVENGQKAKPKKVNKRKKQSDVIDNKQLNIVIASVSAVIASRPNCAHWALSEQEIESITKPLSAMIAESESLAGLGNYSNQIALVMACVTIFIPRIVISTQKAKERKKIERTGQHTDTNVRTSKSGEQGGNTRKTKKGDNGTTGANERKSSTDGKNDANDVPYYGVAIC